MDIPMKLNLFFLWESAAADRDDRGWKPLPQGRHFITDRMAPRAITRFLRSHPGGRCPLDPEQSALAMAFSPAVWYEGR
jgi:hypothetical protein